MSIAVVFGFVVGDRLPPAVGAAPYEVLARQLPRQLVQLLNGERDHGVRFLPFLGTVGGRRSFLRVPELLPVATLARLHRRDEVELLVDGRLSADRLRLRIHAAPTQTILTDVELSFDPQRPFAVLPRLQFEVMGALGLTGPPLAAPPLSGAPLAWFLIAKDELLALEAGLPVDDDQDLLRAARCCAEAAAAIPDVQEVVIASAAQMLRSGRRSDETAALLRLLLGQTTASESVLQRVGGLLQNCGDERSAAAAWSTLARRDPRAAEAVETAAALWFRLGQPRDALELLLQSRAAGALTEVGRGQLAAVADRLGDRALRDQAVDELIAGGPLPPTIARLCATFLFEMGRPTDAQRTIRAALAQSPNDSGLWLDLGRCCLWNDDGAGALAALQRAAELGGSPQHLRDIARLQRLCQAPGLFAIMQQADSAFARDDRAGALQFARQAVRRQPGLGEAWLLLGVVHHRLGHDRRAAHVLRRALARDGQLAEAHNRLGILLVAAGDLQDGHAHLLRAEELAPTDPSPQLHLAQACALLGRRDEAARHIDNAMRLGADAATLEVVRRRFLERAG